jgi:hypothetical protein
MTSPLENLKADIRQLLVVHEPGLIVEAVAEAFSESAYETEDPEMDDWAELLDEYIEEARE